MNARDIDQQMVMQLATERGGQPWICTVYFVVHQGCFYWLSFPERRHSEELATNPRAAIAVALKYSKPVQGIQVEGDARQVREMEEIEVVLRRYVEKYGMGRQFVERYKAGENKHVLYCLQPRKSMLFDGDDQTEVIIT